MEKTTILGVKLNHRVTSATEFQHVLTDHGCNIKTRIGLHPVSNGSCSPSGVILLELYGNSEETSHIEEDIKKIPDAEVQKMEFSV